MRVFVFILCAAFTLAFAQDDSMFDTEETIVQESEGSERDLADELLKGTTLSIGGDFELEAEASYESARDEAFSVGLNILNTTLFLDARPNSDFRMFAKGELAYRTETGLDLSLDELFADFDVDDRVFVRAGKQTLNWGVGYFFSPANLVNLERIDPENPDEELSGPVSIKAQLPVGTNNLTGYLLLDDRNNEEGVDASLAARYEFLLAGFEVTTGALLEGSGHWALMGTASGAVDELSVFAEAVLEGNSEKVFVVEDSGDLSTATSDSLFFSGAVGARYSYTSEAELYTVALSAQYYFNGLGYEDSSLFTDNSAALGALLARGELSLDDLQARGQHYAALSLSAPDLAKTELTPSVFWLSNLSDGSGVVDANLSYAGIDYLTPSIGYRLNYGEEGAEYSPLGVNHSLSLALDLRGSF